MLAAQRQTAEEKQRLVFHGRTRRPQLGDQQQQTLFKLDRLQRRQIPGEKRVWCPVSFPLPVGAGRIGPDLVDVGTHAVKLSLDRAQLVAESGLLYGWYRNLGRGSRSCRAPTRPLATAPAGTRCNKRSIRKVRLNVNADNRMG